MLFKALLNKGTLPLRILGGVPKRSNGTGCKPVDSGLRRFESAADVGLTVEAIQVLKKLQELKIDEKAFRDLGSGFNIN